MIRVIFPIKICQIVELLFLNYIIDIVIFFQYFRTHGEFVFLNIDLRNLKIELK
jgi:hypothetical protein